MMLDLSAIDMPTLVLTSPIDPVVIPESHVAVCQVLPSCTLVPFPPIPEEDIYYLHQLLSETRGLYGAGVPNTVGLSARLVAPQRPRRY